MSTPDSSVSDKRNKGKKQKSSQFIKIIKKRKKKPYTAAPMKRCNETLKYKNMQFVFTPQFIQSQPGDERTARGLKEKDQCAVQRPIVQ